MSTTAKAYAWAGLISAAAVFSVFGADEVALLAREKLSDPEVTPVGESVLAAAKAEWVHGESAHFIYHAESAEAIRLFASEAEFAYRKTVADVAAGKTDKKGHLFIVSDRRIWDRVLRGGDRRKDSLALQMEDDLFVLAGTNGPATPVQIPHEIVHLKLWQLYDGRVPMWLDEGMAGYLGWKAALAYAQTQRKKLVRTFSAVDPSNIKTLDELTAMTAYPENAADAQAFCRQSEELVRGIGRKIGDENLWALANDTAGGEVSWKEFLRTSFAYSDNEFAWLEREVKRRTLSTEDK